MGADNIKAALWMSFSQLTRAFRKNNEIGFREKGWIMSTLPRLVLILIAWSAFNSIMKTVVQAHEWHDKIHNFVDRSAFKAYSYQVPNNMNITIVHYPLYISWYLWITIFLIKYPLKLCCHFVKCCQFEKCYQFKKCY